MVEYVGTRHQRARAARRAARAQEPILRRLDWWLVAAVAGAVAYGLWAIAGITRHDIPGNPSFYRRYWRALFGGTVGLMVLVILAGAATRGSKRWIDLGFFRFQPSEFGKLLFVLALAGFLADQARRIGEPRTTLLAPGLPLVPILLVFLQPDLGTALVYAGALAAMLFVAGTRWTHLTAAGAIAVAGVV